MVPTDTSPREAMVASIVAATTQRHYIITNVTKHQLTKEIDHLYNNYIQDMNH